MTPPQMDRIVLHQPLLELATIQEQGQGDRVYDAKVITGGVFMSGLPAPGAPVGARVRIRSEVIDRRHQTMDGKRIDLEHSDQLIDEVGFARRPVMNDGALRAQIVLQQARPKFTEALGFVEGRLQAKQVPNVSAEFGRPVFREATPEEKPFFDLDLVDFEAFEGIALVSQGACRPGNGDCGIGLKGHASSLLLMGATHKPRALSQDADVSGSRDSNMPGDEEAKKQAEKNQLDLTARVAELEACRVKNELALKARDEELLALKKAQAERDEQDRLSLLAQVKDAAPEGMDLKFLGDKPTKEHLVLALAAIKGSGQKSGGGRHTSPGSRDGERANDKLDLKGLRAKFRLTDQTASRLPKVMQKHTKEILGRGGVA